MRKPKKQKNPLNDLSGSLTPFDPNQTLIAMVDNASSYCAAFYLSDVHQILDKHYLSRDPARRRAGARVLHGRRQSDDGPQCAGRPQTSADIGNRKT
jgi:hypothetical protein